MKKALITGVTGQDGAYLAGFLLAKGYEVHGIKRRSSLFNTARIDNLYEDPHLPSRHFILHYGDMTDSSSLIHIVQKVQPDEIYNLAAQSHVQVSFEEPEYTANSDALGVLRLLENTLSRAGYRVLAADGGWSAIRAYENSAEPIHLLLTDVIMPDLTGPVLAERLRARQPDLRVLFISGFHDAELVQRFVTRKGYTLLPKPFTPAGLLRVVDESLNQARGAS